MARSDYAVCDLCGRKVFYDADTDIPDGTVIMHPECAAKVVAEAEARGYQRAIDALRYGQRIADRAWQANAASADYSLRDAADYLVQRAKASAQTAGDTDGR